MISVGVFVLIFIAVFSTSVSGAGGPCERIESKTCYMQSTVINSPNFLITSARDSTVETFWSRFNSTGGNKKLKHLPKNLAEKFPKLLTLNADWCFIKKVKKENFKGLSKLQYLHLWGNQIEKIDDDTFEYIPAVKWVVLGNNKLKRINGRAFAALSKLIKVVLLFNDCIDETFLDETIFEEMPEIVNSKCGFAEAPKLNGNCLI